MDFIIEDTTPNLSFFMDCPNGQQTLSFALETPCNQELHISEMVQVVNGLDGKDGKDATGITSVISKTSSEAIPSHTPVAIINGMAYKMDSTKAYHAFAFMGFSTNGCLVGETCNIQTTGILSLTGWGLQANTHYLVGENGVLQLNQQNTDQYNLVVAYALDSNSINILHRDAILTN
jgi:hypothetical protein